VYEDQVLAAFRDTRPVYTESGYVMNIAEPDYSSSQNAVGDIKPYAAAEVTHVSVILIFNQ